MKNRSSYLLLPSVGYVLLFLVSCATPPTNPKGVNKPSYNQPMQPPTNARVIVVTRAVEPKDKPAYVETKPASPVTINPTSKAVISTQAWSPKQAYGSFEEWKQDFILRIQRRYGHTATRLFGQAKLSERAVRLDGNQAEFDKMPWEYLDGITAASRVSQGQQKRRELLNVLEHAERRYGVPASIVTAIWGVESSYGKNMGNFSLVDALSSLAYDGRRREFAENQLMAMIDLVNKGDVSESQLVGSWAGGMGHTQFIPKTWLDEGVDGDGDGRRNPFNEADALTSTASYLANAGWIAMLPAYIEVSLPTGFDYRYLKASLSLDEWRRLGLSGRSGQPLVGNHKAKLWLPAGINGPILLTTQNFEAIKVYNNSSNYALAVSALANLMNGQTAFYASFPRHERPLSRQQVQQLQQLLTSQGFDTKGVDGVVGTNTKLAFADWQAANGRIPDGFISQSSIQGLVY